MMPCIFQKNADGQTEVFRAVTFFSSSWRSSPSGRTPREGALKIERAATRKKAREAFVQKLRGPLSSKTKWWRWRESNPRLPVFQLKLLHA